MATDASYERPSSRPRRPLSQRAAEARARAAALRELAGSRLEQERQRRPTVQWAFAVHAGDRRFAGSLLAGGIAFRLFLWLLPFSLVLVTALGLAASLSSRTPEELAKEAGLSAALAGTVARGVNASDSGRVILLIVGLWLMLAAGKGVVKALKTVSILAWREQGRVQASIKASLVFCLSLAGVLALSAAAGALYAGGLWTDILAVALSVALLAAGAVWASWVLPHPDDVRWTSLVPGALILALGIELLRLATSVYFVRKVAKVGDLYGAMGFASVLLLWLYVLGRLTVVSFLVNATLWRRSREAPSSDSPREGGAADRTR